MLEVWSKRESFGCASCGNCGVGGFADDVECRTATDCYSRNYVAVAADTFSSELGILSKSKPRLITAPWRVVPPGTNGGVTVTGIQAGLLGAFILSITATLLVPFCGPSSSTFGNSNVAWDTRSKLNFALAMTVVGLCGSLLDSVLGALLQASVVDVRTGKVVEGDGGKKVLVYNTSEAHAKKHGKSQGSRKIEVGYDVLSNNGVNFLMATSMSAFAIVGSTWLWNIPLTEVFGIA